MLISVDGGATKTVAVCYSEDGKIHGMGVSGPGNYRTSGIEMAEKNIREAISRALERSNIEENEVKKFTLALAGVKDSNVKNELINSLMGKNQSGKIIMLNDGEAGFDCRFPGKDGIVVCPGTGLVSFGRKGASFKRASGWGWLLGDEGGAFYIARSALQEALKIFDGRSKHKSEITESVLEYFEISNMKELVNRIYANPLNIGKIASFASIIAQLAEKGDELALGIMQKSAREASQCIISLREDLFNDEPVSFSGYGGLFRASNLYWKNIRKEVLERYPDMMPFEPLYGYHAVIGSIYLSLREEEKGLEFNVDVEAKYMDGQIRRLSREERKNFLLMNE